MIIYILYIIYIIWHTSLINILLFSINLSHLLLFCIHSYTIEGGGGCCDVEEGV